MAKRAPYLFPDGSSTNAPFHVGSPGVADRGEAIARTSTTRVASPGRRTPRTRAGCSSLRRIDKNALRVRHSRSTSEAPHGTDPDTIRGIPTTLRHARRRPTGSPAGPSTTASSMSGWVQNARQRPESERTIGEMAAMLELSAALLRAETPVAAVRRMVQVCFTHLHVPLVALLPDRSGTGWFVAASRGVGVKRADIARSIEGVSALQLGRSTRHRLAARVAQVADRERAEAIPAGSAVLLGIELRPDHRAFLRTAGSLLAEALAHLSAVGWAQIRNDNLDLALAWTAHELRGPLIGARAALGHVRIDDQGTKSGELLQQTRDELEQLADLVGPLLRWSAGSSSLRMREVDLVQTVGEVVTSCRMEFVDADLVVRAPDRSRSALTPGNWPGPSPTWSATRWPTRRAGSSVKIDVDTDGERARIRVRDRGPGVPAAEQHLIFDPFARDASPPRRRCGKGLGLFIARRIVEAHGGSSACGRSAGDGVLHRAPAPGRGETAIRVLIVDDHLLFAEAIRVTLTDMGMTVVGIVATAAEGLDAAAEPATRSGVGRSGSSRPNGLALGAEILAISPHEVVALTALEDERSVQEALRLGFHGYLTKHTEADQFKRSLAERRSTVRRSSRIGWPVTGHGRARSSATWSSWRPSSRSVSARCCNCSPRVRPAADRDRLGVSPNTVRTHVQGSCRSCSSTRAWRPPPSPCGSSLVKARS